MKRVTRTSKFKKDVKRLQKRGKRFDEFQAVVRKVASDEALEPKYRDHPLLGEYKGTRECHVEPD